MRKLILIIGTFFLIFIFLNALWGLEGIAAAILNKEKLSLGTLVHANPGLFILLIILYFASMVWLLIIGILYLIRRDIVILFMFLGTFLLLLISFLSVS